MDKVIIDGVDVSECEHYRAEIETKMPYGEYEILKDKCHYSGIEIIQNCKGNKGCIYKQLKRLQAEYDDLHLSYAGCKTANTGLKELNKNLEEENKILNNMLKVNDSTKYDYYKFIKENEQLKKSIDRLMKNKEIKTIDSEIALLNAELQQENKRLKARLRPLEDSYFKGLSSIEIAELAKKSIRVTAENRKLEYALQDIRDIAGFHTSKDDSEDVQSDMQDILDKINEVIGAEE